MGLPLAPTSGAGAAGEDAIPARNRPEDRGDKRHHKLSAGARNAWHAGYPSYKFRSHGHCMETDGEHFGEYYVLNRAICSQTVFAVVMR